MFSEVYGKIIYINVGHNKFELHNSKFLFVLYPFVRCLER